MNTTEKYKLAVADLRGVFLPGSRHLNNDYWRVMRNIDCGSSGNPSLRKTRYPSDFPGNWVRNTPLYREKQYQRNPLKVVLRFQRLQRMIDSKNQQSINKFLRLCDARKVAFGWDYPLQEARKTASRPTPRSVRQERMRQLISINQSRIRTTRTTS